MEEEKTEGFKKQIFLYSIALSIMVISYLINLRMSIHIGIIVYWIIYGFQHLVFKRINNKELIILICIVALNMFLDNSYFYARLDILMGIYFAILIIYYISKGVTKYKLLKIMTIALIIPLVLFTNFYFIRDNLIKDRGLEKCIREEFKRHGLRGEITESDLKKITSLSFSRRDHVYDLSGIEHLKNLKRLYIMDGTGIRNIDKLSLLPKLKELSLDDIKLSTLLDSGEFLALEELEINYSEIDSSLYSSNFPNIKRLDVQGVELRDLSFIKELQSLEELRLSFSELDSIEGIEELRLLKRLKLYKTKIKAIDSVKESKSLEVIDLRESNVGDIEKLKESSNLRIIIRPSVTNKLNLNNN